MGGLFEGDFLRRFSSECRLEGLSFFYTCLFLSVMMKKQRNFEDAPHGDAIS